jgi:prevent-host-death family protein
MKEISAIKTKNTLSALLDLAESGEGVVITRHGKEVARLVPPRGTVNRDAAGQAASVSVT